MKGRYCDLGLLSILILSMLFSCDSTVETSREENRLSALEDAVEGVSIKRLSENSYELSLSFREDLDGVSMPDSILVNGFDDRNILNKTDNKLIYNSKVKGGNFKKAYEKTIDKNTVNSRAKEDVSVGCDVSFTKPGEYDSNCGDTCSESLLGADALFCVCAYDCRVEVDFF